MSKWGGNLVTVYTDVSIDIDDILPEIDTDDLVEELKRRGQYKEPQEEKESLTVYIKTWFKAVRNQNIWSFTKDEIFNIIQEELKTL